MITRQSLLPANNDRIVQEASTIIVRLVSSTVTITADRLEDCFATRSLRESNDQAASASKTVMSHLLFRAHHCAQPTASTKGQRVMIFEGPLWILVRL